MRCRTRSKNAFSSASSSATSSWWNVHASAPISYEQAVHRHRPARDGPNRRLHQGQFIGIRISRWLGVSAAPAGPPTADVLTHLVAAFGTLHGAVLSRGWVWQRQTQCRRSVMLSAVDIACLPGRRRCASARWRFTAGWRSCVRHGLVSYTLIVIVFAIAGTPLSQPVSRVRTTVGMACACTPANCGYARTLPSLGMLGARDLDGRRPLRGGVVRGGIRASTPPCVRTFRASPWSAGAPRRPQGSGPSRSTWAAWPSRRRGRRRRWRPRRPGPGPGRRRRAWRG